LEKEVGSLRFEQHRNKEVTMSNSWIGEWEALQNIEFENLIVNMGETFRVTEVLHDGSAIVRKDQVKTNTSVEFLQTLPIKECNP
jgi:hypothetical protein